MADIEKPAAWDPPHGVVLSCGITVQEPFAVIAHS
jgi:hypothetical protein